MSPLSGCQYPKPLVPLPKSIAWGCHYESIAIEKYTFHMKALGKNVVVSKSGFIVHPEKGWLGASPDGFVKDTTYEFPDGLLEIKCPYSKQEETPEAACLDLNFYCKLENYQIRLKNSHAYFHQVQLQIYVASDLCKWCDFCVYTCKGKSVERIFPDKKWQKDTILQLQSFFYDFMLPEIVLGKYKPSYYL